MTQVSSHHFWQHTVCAFFTIFQATVTIFWKQTIKATDGQQTDNCENLQKPMDDYSRLATVNHYNMWAKGWTIVTCGHLLDNHAYMLAAKRQLFILDLAERSPIKLVMVAATILLCQITLKSLVCSISNRGFVIIGNLILVQFKLK